LTKTSRNKNTEERHYSSLNTGDRWKEAEELLPCGGMVSPIIIYVDKTTTDNYGKEFKPVYMSVGNYSTGISVNT
jgi:hypothetical protein